MHISLTSQTGIILSQSARFGIRKRLHFVLLLFTFLPAEKCIYHANGHCYQLSLCFLLSSRCQERADFLVTGSLKCLANASALTSLAMASELVFYFQPRSSLINRGPGDIIIDEELLSCENIAQWDGCAPSFGLRIPPDGCDNLSSNRTLLQGR